MKNKFVTSTSTILLAVLLLVLLPVTVFSAPHQLPEKGTLTIHRYLLDSMDEALQPGDGNAAGTLPSSAAPLEGIEFTIWQVDTSQGVNVENLSELQKHRIASSKQTAKTNQNGEAFYDELKAGLYYVSETNSQGRIHGVGTPQYFLPSEDFIVSVPMETPEKDGWITDVHAYPKSQSLSIDKFVGDAGLAEPDFSQPKTSKYKPVFIGAYFGWTIETELPHDIGEQGRIYKVREPISPGFEYAPGTLQVYSVPGSETPVSKGFSLSAGKHYTLVQTGAYYEIELTEAGRQLVKNRYDNAGIKDRFLRIKMDCKLTENVLVGVDLPSSSTLEYSYIQTTQEGTEQKRIVNSEVLQPPSVHTGQLRLTKVDAANANIRLPGAVFGLARSKGEAQANKFLGIGTTGSNGELLFKGFSYGAAGDRADENSANTTYWLVEITAPSGYLILDEPTEIFFAYQQNPANKLHYFADVMVYNEAIVHPPDTTPPAPVTPVRPADPPTPTPLEPEPAPEPTTSIPDTTTPAGVVTVTPPEVELENEDTQLTKLEATWSLVSLIVTILGFGISIVFFVKFLLNLKNIKREQREKEKARRAQKQEKDIEQHQESFEYQQQENQEKEQKKFTIRSRLVQVLLSVVGLAMGILFIIIENLKLKMAWVNQWTWLFAVLFLVQLILFIPYGILHRKKKDHPQEDENQL